MNRKEFIERVGVAAIAWPTCLALLSGCSSSADPTPASPSGPVDFTVDISSGALSKNGGYLVHNGIIIARTTSGQFIAVSSTCTHEGATITYESSANDFYCPRHGAMFDSAGKVTRGPASRSLVQYQTSLSGNSLRIYS